MDLSNLLSFSLAVFNIFLLVPSTFVVYFISRESNHTIYTLRSFSVYCNNLSLSPDEDGEIFDLNRNRLKISLSLEGKYICEDSNISNIVNKMTERASRLRLAKGLEEQQFLSCGNESVRPSSGYNAAHFSKMSNPHIVDGTIQWERQSAYIDKRIRFHGGELTIQEGQTYFVYASVLMNISKSDTTNRAKPFRFSLRLCKKKYDYERTLLGKTAVFDTSYGEIRSSLHIAGPLVLRKEDKIYVKVSSENDIVLDSHGNTFGIFPL